MAIFDCCHGYQFSTKFWLHFQIHFSHKANEIQGNDIHHHEDESPYILIIPSNAWELFAISFKMLPNFVKFQYQNLQILTLIFHTGQLQYGVLYN